MRDAGCKLAVISNPGSRSPDRTKQHRHHWASELSVKIHKMTLDELPKFEMYEEGTQIRRSAKSIRSNIVEGYGRRRYKNDFIRFLVYAHSSCDETIDHLDTLWECESLTNQALYDELKRELDFLGGKLNRFIASVEQQHQGVREDETPYELDSEP
jgi:four helix bundle protein